MCGTPRFEPLSLRFCNDSDIDSDLPDFNLPEFKGRILLLDRDHAHELYNGKTGEYVSVVDSTNDDDDPPLLQQDSSEGCKKRRWLNMFPKTGQYNLLMTGPKYAVEITDVLVLMIQTEDVKEYDKSGDYADFLTERYIPMLDVPCAQFQYWKYLNTFRRYNEKISLKACFSTGSVILEGMVFWNSLPVRVVVRPQGIDDSSVEISGKITLFSGDFKNPKDTSLLFSKKAKVYVLASETLPLLREKFAVDFGSSFTVKVDLCVCGHNVNFDAVFTVDDYADFKHKPCVTWQKEKSGEFGKIEVIATGDVFE